MIKTSAAGEILTSIISKDINRVVFLHNTREEKTAREIVSRGFQFEEQLAYSTDQVNQKDPVEINYFLVHRKEYGKYTVIIEIDKDLFKKYSSMAEKSDLHFEELLTVTPPVLSDNDEYIYTLSYYYIKGYCDNTSGKFVENKDFNPGYESPIYIENYQRLIRRGER